ncbi:MAG: cupredoxin domain-containing protein, partial [Actinomycetota bacterium]|nr:cupredoxin domain-containing protein [Actinomycetota bacterium]
MQDRKHRSEQMMRNGLIAAVAATVLLVTLNSAAAAERTVTITSTGFVPADVTIAAGDTITWRNTDSAAHQVVFDRTPCTLTIQPGATGSCTFRAGGRFNYRDPSRTGSFRGTVTVTGARTSVTLQTSRPTAVHGAAITLSGVVSSQESGQPVSVSAQTCGATTFTRVGGATTTAGGNWTLVVRPTINTVYRVRWRTTESSTATVRVMPRIRLGRVGSRFTVRVTAAQPFTGKVVAFQRYRPLLRRWVTLRRVTLGASATPTAGTVVTTGRFRARVRRGWRVRTFLAQSQAGTCYLAAPSNTL